MHAAIGVVVGIAASLSSPTLPAPNPMPVMLSGPCPTVQDAPGCYEDQTNTIWVNENDPFLVEHELGHAYDAQYLDAGERHRFRRLTGAGHAAWLPADGVYDDDLDYAGEDFADTYAECQLGYREASRRVCRFIERTSRPSRRRKRR